MNRIYAFFIFVGLAFAGAGSYAQVPRQSRVAEAARRLNMADSLLRRGQFERAAPLFREARLYLQRAASDTLLSDLHRTIGEYYRNAGLFQEAIYELAVATRYSRGDTVRAAKAVTAQAETWWRDGELAKALHADSVALRYYREAGLNSEITPTVFHIVLVLNALRRFERTEAILLKQVLPRYGGNRPERLGCFEQLAIGYQVRKRFSEAKWFYIQQNMLARDLGQTNYLIRSLLGLAAVKMSIGDRVLAERDLGEVKNLLARSPSISNEIAFNRVLQRFYSGRKEAGQAAGRADALLARQAKSALARQAEAQRFKILFELPPEEMPRSAPRPSSPTGMIIVLVAGLLVVIMAIVLLRKRR